MNQPLPIRPDQILHSSLSGYWQVRTLYGKAGRVKMQKLTDALEPCNTIMSKPLADITDDVWHVHSEAVAVPLAERLATPARYAVHVVLTVVMFSVMSLCWLERNGWLTITTINDFDLYL